MFKKGLQEKLAKIFDLDKVVFDLPSESQEQEAAFIHIEKAMTSVKDKKEFARVTGKISIFAQEGKLPYGYLPKQLDKADYENKKDLFFYDFEENKGTFRNLVERSCSFLYFYVGQFDPALGTITEVNLSVAES